MYMQDAVYGQLGEAVPWISLDSFLRAHLDVFVCS